MNTVINRIMIQLLLMTTLIGVFNGSALIGFALGMIVVVGVSIFEAVVKEIDKTPKQ